MTKKICKTFKSITWLKPKEAMKKALYVLCMTLIISTFLGLYNTLITYIISLI